MSSRIQPGKTTSRSQFKLDQPEKALARRSRGASHTRLMLEPLEQRELFAVSPLSGTPAVTGVRSIDGTGNNLLHPEWGSTAEQLLRLAPAEYGDLKSAVGGTTRPSAR